MSVILTLLRWNQPLHRCKEFKTEEDLVKEFGRRSGGVSFSEREVRNVARRIVSALSQTCVAEQVAKEWGSLPSMLQRYIMQIGNEGGHSGNVGKGFAYLDQLLGGTIRRAPDTDVTERRLRVYDGVLISERHRIDPARARAQALYANTERPANYDSLSKREKKQIDRELTLARKEMRQQKR
ncbi:MAG: hypothetical protein HYT93_01110 [Parcubacteria group bacterium]|nr:hypothetical protein [Parcubacteria group bacterium]